MRKVKGAMSPFGKGAMSPCRAEEEVAWPDQGLLGPMRPPVVPGLDRS